MPRETDAPFRLRAARVEELDALSTLCLRSKAVWGYDKEFMNACRAELTLNRRLAGDVYGVVVKKVPQPEEWIRRRGEDIAAGAEVLAAGTRLTAAHVGVAASVGAARLEVFRRLKKGKLVVTSARADVSIAAARLQAHEANE